MSRPENVKWVDVSSNNLFVRSLIQKASFLSQSNLTFPQGLRGLASVLVISTHITRGFFLDLMKPTSEVDTPPKLFQYPFLRVLTQGRIGVAIFALVTGYVCALKPIRQIRAGERNAMFNGVSRSAFRRVPRLILPTAIATTITWFFCQFGVFQVAEKADSWWLNFSAPRMTPYIGEAIYSLLLEMIMTWSRGWNMYDHHTWTMLPLLKSSMLVFIFLFAAAYCKTRYRIMLELGLLVYFYISNDCKSYVNPLPSFLC
jgi:Acyltransferase family